VAYFNYWDLIMFFCGASGIGTGSLYSGCRRS